MKGQLAHISWTPFEFNSFAGPHIAVVPAEDYFDDAKDHTDVKEDATEGAHIKQQPRPVSEGRLGKYTLAINRLN